MTDQTADEPPEPIDVSVSLTAALDSAKAAGIYAATFGMMAECRAVGAEAALQGYHEAVAAWFIKVQQPGHFTISEAERDEFMNAAEAARLLAEDGYRRDAPPIPGWKPISDCDPGWWWVRDLASDPTPARLYSDRSLTTVYTRHAVPVGDYDPDTLHAFPMPEPPPATP